MTTYETTILETAKAEAALLGAEAFSAGRGPAPAQDAKLCAILRGAYKGIAPTSAIWRQVGEISGAFAKAWHAANMATEVEGWGR